MTQPMNHPEIRVLSAVPLMRARLDRWRVSYHHKTTEVAAVLPFIYTLSPCQWRVFSIFQWHWGWGCVDDCRRLQHWWHQLLFLLIGRRTKYRIWIRPQEKETFSLPAFSNNFTVSSSQSPQNSGTKYESVSPQAPPVHCWESYSKYRPPGCFFLRILKFDSPARGLPYEGPCTEEALAGGELGVHKCLCWQMQELRNMSFLSGLSNN